MKLYEFFGNLKHDSRAEDDPKPLGKEEEDEIADQVFWYIIDHDDLHKKHFHPKAKEIKSAYEKDKKMSGHNWKIWLDMAKEGCLEFYKKHEMKGHPSDTFDKEFFIDLCKRLADHYHKDIVNGAYKI